MLEVSGEGEKPQSPFAFYRDRAALLVFDALQVIVPPLLMLPEARSPQRNQLSSAFFDYLVDDAIFFSFLSGHEKVAICIPLNLF